MVPFTPAWWVPGPHLQTLWRRLFTRPPALDTRTEWWETPDDDEVEIVRLSTPDNAGANAPRFLLMHGLEGGANSHYAHATLAAARDRGWQANMLLFRSCGSRPNRARRFYHSGETTDLALVVQRLIDERPEAPIVLAGYSLGGNVLVKYLGERGSRVPEQVRGAVAVSVPFDLARGARRIQQGFSRVYQRSFLRSLRRKAEQKRLRYPDLYDPERLAAARTLEDFDDAVTAPLHGFRDVDDYYTRSSALRFVAGVRVPTLLLSSLDDPFLPADVLEEVRQAVTGNTCLELDFTRRGGHVGFIGGRVPWRPDYYAERRLTEFLSGALDRKPRTSPTLLVTGTSGKLRA